MTKNQKKWTLIVGVFLIVASFFLNESFKSYMNRKKNIQKAKAEIQSLTEQNEALRKKLLRLKEHPKEYENLVRSELGYLRPGEKEIRFHSDKKKERRKKTP